ncbi:MAG TPA: hypothetical protein VEI83_05240 [Acidimicrobiales bacterium]|nr:hypothetical protein [Acidimicrobiales bacterium]
MPWCDTCDRVVDEEELEEGKCPTCQTDLLARRPIPWHFKLMIGVTAVYLAYRAYQGITWLVHHG